MPSVWLSISSIFICSPLSLCICIYLCLSYSTDIQSRLIEYFVPGPEFSSLLSKSWRIILSISYHSTRRGKLPRVLPRFARTAYRYHILSLSLTYRTTDQCKHTILPILRAPCPVSQPIGGCYSASGRRQNAHVCMYDRADRKSV